MFLGVGITGLVIVNDWFQCQKSLSVCTKSKY